FRFHARYGKGEPDAVGLHACLRAKFHIAKLSRERITQEYVKILPATGAAAVLDMLRVYDILPDLINPDFNQGVYVRLADITRAYPEYFDFKLLFAYSVWRNKADIQLSFLARYFVLSGAYKLYLERLLGAYRYH